MRKQRQDRRRTTEASALDDRLATLKWMNDKLAVEHRLLPVSRPSSHDMEPHTWADHTLANAHINQAAQGSAVDEAAVSEMRRETKRVEASVADTPPAILLDQYGGLEPALVELARLAATLDEHCGTAGPGL